MAAKKKTAVKVKSTPKAAVKARAKAAEPAKPKRDAHSVAEMVVSVVDCPWSPRILALLADGGSRPGALLGACPGLTAKVMNEKLEKMIAFGLAERATRGGEPPDQAEYTLTPLGCRFMRILDEVDRLQETVDRK